MPRLPVLAREFVLSRSGEGEENQVMRLSFLAEQLPSVNGYELVEKIGEGGTGAVYRARCQRTGTIVAVKVLTEQMATNPILMRRFEQEFRVASKFDHPGVVRALDFDDTQKEPFLVMEYVEGETLGEKLNRQGRLSEDAAVSLILQVCAALQYVHSQGIIHRDVKPDNVLVTADGRTRLTDLGLVKEVTSNLTLTQTGRGLGTPHFMAPEQFRNAKSADVRSDVYSVGAMLYQMVTGQLPFAKVNPVDCWIKKMNHDIAAPRHLVPALSLRIERVIRRAMSACPEDRPASCAEFASELAGHEPKTIEKDWLYVRYECHDGRDYTMKKTVATIRKWIVAGLLDNTSEVRLSRSEDGPFLPIDQYEELRGLPRAPTKGAIPVDGNTPCPGADRVAEVLENAVVLEPGQTGPSLPWAWVIVAALAAVVVGLVCFRL